MNTITIQSKLFHSYFDDKQFCANAGRQSFDYIKKYRKTGEVAFYNFVLETDDKSSYPIIFIANNQMNDTFSIIIGAALYKKGQKYIGAFINYDVSVIHDAFDIYMDIPDGDDFIAVANEEIISDFGNDINRWPNEMKNKLLEKSIPLICIYSKIQTVALKTSKKIQKATKRTRSKPMKFQPLSEPQKPNVIRLDEKITLTIDANDEPDSKREFIRHCEAWMVRGHYRHYKSGKVVYISPYKKGTGKLNDKIYKTNIKSAPQDAATSIGASK